MPTWFDATAEEKAALTAAIDRGRELIASRHRPDGIVAGAHITGTAAHDGRNTQEEGDNGWQLRNTSRSEHGIELWRP